MTIEVSLKVVKGVRCLFLLNRFQKPSTSIKDNLKTKHTTCLMILFFGFWYDVKKPDTAQKL